MKGLGKLSRAEADYLQGREIGGKAEEGRRQYCRGEKKLADWSGAQMVWL